MTTPGNNGERTEGAGLDADLMDLVRFALEHHTERTRTSRLLVWENGRERVPVWLPSGGDAITAAVEALEDIAPVPSVRRCVVVWRVELDMPNGGGVPVRYACGHLAGHPTSTLVVQHCAATPVGERLVGEPDPVDRAAPLIPNPLHSTAHRDLPIWRTSRGIAVCAGVFGGLGAAGAAVAAVDRYAPVAVHAATVVEAHVREPARHAGHYDIVVETDDGDRVDFAYHSETELLYRNLQPAERIEVSLSELTGRPVAVHTADGHYDLVGTAAAGWEAGFGVALVLATAAYACVLRPRIRRWAVSAAGVAFVLYLLRLLGV